VPSVSHLAPTHLGLDVHKDTISVAILAPDRDGPDVERIAHDEASVRRLVGRFPNPRLLRACYEAGPTGYELARLLASMGVGCEVIAPSLIPKAPGDKVKTDRRDCRRLARLYRAGELVAIRIPSVQEEAVRDLCRARADMVADRTRARHRLGKFLLRHGRPWRGGNAWTLTHERWLLQQRFEEPALAATYAHYRAVPGRPRRAAGGDRGRPGRLVRPGAVRRRRGSPGRLPGHHPAGGADAGQRGR
jgi:transposase